jgi:hypothetical protein
MDIRVEVTTTVRNAVGALVTKVTTAEETSIGDNPRLTRVDIASSDVYGKAASTNLDQIEAGVRRG